jgi:pimeloyl-ACP methyl ester carboxylesterase
MEIVVLQHGYNKSQRDMRPLERMLSRSGFENHLKQLVSREATSTLHLVGHSMGGLVIRHVLARYHVPNLGKCVLVAPPNQGTALANLAASYLRPLLQIYKPLQALRTNGYVQHYDSLGPSTKSQSHSPQIGIIAGSNSKLLLGRLLTSPNDGRVEVESTKLADMTDFLIMPYGHKEIHHRLEVAAQIEYFLRVGHFNH